MDGLDATRAILAEFPDAKIIMLTTYDGDEDIFRALAAGAKGDLLKIQPIGGVSGESVVEQWRTLWRQQRITERRQQRLRVAMLSHAIAASATMETTRRLVRCKARSDVRIALRTEARSDVRIGLRDEARSDVRIALRDEAGCMQPHSKECADSQECTAGFVPRAEHRAPPAQFRTTGASPETFARSFGATIHAGPVTCERLPAPLV